MNNITDEILNDYIDNSLDINVINKLTEELKHNNEAFVRLKALKIVDTSLKNIPVVPAPIGFTEKVMQKIISTSKKYKHQLIRFMIFISSIFGLIISVVFATAWYIGSNTVVDTSKSEKITLYISKAINIFNSFVNNETMLTVVSTITLISLLTVYMFVDAHRNLKNKLKNLSNH